MTEKAFPIHFIITGGTIDSRYEGTKDTVVPLDHSIIPKFIENQKLDHKTEFTEICMKDSREINQDDMKNILDAIENSPHNHFIITHGTYTMPDTARYLKANLKRDNATIVLTAAMLPMAEFTMSDGGFNLGYSIAKVQDQPNGIYVCMNGKVFSPEEVMKIISDGKFTSIFGEK
ncbi:asparaginase [Patescibacteria group bacterium]|nr:asparaginase [Patescibacteria group bacterium]MBU1075026.1 asparaginase [Patescibacteria group bacterium]MBU1951796.1 asparaginase [Patescibacteria group bacterium]MBU2229160.1 asparaginase [Patescibacteria group bacterium]